MRARLAARTLIAMLVLCVALAAQGITTTRNAQVLYGSAKNCSQPASIKLEKVRKATKEWKTIKAEGVQKGSARYSLLTAAMNSRIKKACKAAAQSDSRDCVIRKKDIQDARGLTVKDLTQEVIDNLDS